MSAETIAKPVYIHATALVVGTRGIVIRGPSRAGKSSLALELLQLAPQAAHLIGDDRISLECTEGGIVMRGHPLIQGKIEKRGTGILDVGFVASGIARLVLDLQAAEEATQDNCEPSFSHVALCGMPLPAYRLPWYMDRAGFVLDHLAGLVDDTGTGRFLGRVSDKFGAIDFP